MKPYRMSLQLLLVCVLSVTCAKQPEKAAKEFQLGKLAYQKRNIDGALEHFTKAQKLDPSLLNAALMHAKILYFKKNYPQALKKIEGILNKEEGHIGALYWKARILIRIEKPETENAEKNESEAIRCLHKVVELNGHHIPARTLLALLYEKRKMYKEALYEYKSAVNEEKSLLNVRANLCLMYHRLGLKEQSKNELGRALKIAEATGISKKNLLKIKEELER